MEKPRSLSSPEKQNVRSHRAHCLTIVGWRPGGRPEAGGASTPAPCAAQSSPQSPWRKDSRSPRLWIRRRPAPRLLHERETLHSSLWGPLEL